MSLVRVERRGGVTHVLGDTAVNRGAFRRGERAVLTMRISCIRPIERPCDCSPGDGWHIPFKVYQDLALDRDARRGQAAEPGLRSCAAAADLVAVQDDR